MKKNKILISIIIVTVIAAIFVTSSIEPSKTYEKYIKMIDNKKSFNLLVTEDNNSNTIRYFEYYKDTYSVTYNHILKNEENKKYKKLISKISDQASETSAEMFFHVKKGEIQVSLFGEFNEESIRNIFIDQGIIDKKYKNIDYPVSDNSFNEYFSRDKKYCILYIDMDNPRLYDFRTKLVKENIPSLIIYDGNLNTMDTYKTLNKELKYDDEVVSDKLPIAIQIKENKVLKHHENISLDNIIKNCQ